MEKKLRRLELVERGVLSGVRLSAWEVEALRRYRSVRGHTGRQRPVFQVTPEGGDTFGLGVGSLVGSVRLGDIQIDIVPKVGIARAIYMLAHYPGAAHFGPLHAVFGQGDTFVEAVARTFLLEVEGLLREGLLEKYEPRREVGFHPRGRLDFQAIAASFLSAPVDYVFDDFTVDNEFNRLIVEALFKLAGLGSVSPFVRGEARRLQLGFRGVSASRGRPVPGFEGLGAVPGRYRTSVQLAIMILRNSGVERGEGVQGDSLLFSMDEVFERYLTAVIGAGISGHLIFDPQATQRRLYLDRQREFRIQPDLLFWALDGQCLLVGDVKYKEFGEQSPPRHADLYQVVTYAKVAGSDVAIVIYVGKGLGAVVEVGVGPRIYVHPFDVSDVLIAEERLVGAVRGLLGG